MASCAQKNVTFPTTTIPGPNGFALRGMDTLFFRPKHQKNVLIHGTREMKKKPEEMDLASWMIYLNNNSTRGRRGGLGIDNYDVYNRLRSPVHVSRFVGRISMDRVLNMLLDAVRSRVTTCTHQPRTSRVDAPLASCLQVFRQHVRSLKKQQKIEA